MILNLKDNFTLGLSLIFISIIAIIISVSGIKLFYIPWIWPIFLIISGLSLEISYLKFKKDLVAAFAGSILFIYGISSFILNILNIVPQELYLSIIYPEKFILFTICLGLSIAYSQTFIFFKRDSRYLLKASIFILICIINVLFLIFNKFFMNLIIPTITIGTGSYLIYLPFKYK